MAISTKAARDLLKSTGDILRDSAADLLASSDFISRTIGMNNSYEDIMLVVQALGRQPVSLLGKDYLFIFDHVRRNYQQGTTIASTMYGGGDYWCPKFTFYKEKPTVRFADPYNDTLNLLDRWIPNFTPNVTKSENINKFYAESNDGAVNNKTINSVESNMGTATGQYSTSFQNLASCDLIKKTNDNFRNGKYNTLVARFHTNSMDSRDPENPTQTAISHGYGMSHGRNLLKINPDEPNGYNNPYCRVWTYHHQYHRMVDAIRPFGDAKTAEELESLELSGDYDTVGFRTLESKNYGVKGGSVRLDTHGVLNYENGFVNIAPTAKIKDYFEHKPDDKGRKSVSTKRCMFSIENLAWRDKKSKYDQFEAYGLSAEQRGPLGGRIMWFPPYDINFSENVQVKWNSNEFIGRGENIYTYTNTERRGNLSFTLLIDHPSILDYWTGHEKNGMKNQGDTLLPGNTDGVDGKDNQENTLLRFFAGCDVLSAKPQEYWMREKTPANVPEPPSKTDVPQPDPQNPEEAKPVTKKMYAILYFPNNYSGTDDDANFAVDYLMYGFGTQKEIRSGLTIDVQPCTSETGKGYEVNNNGISLVSWDEIKDELKYGLLNSGYEGIAEYIKTDYDYNGDDIMPAKQIGDTASESDDSTSPTSEWKYKRWFYRVDEKTANQRLVGKPENYLDQKSYKLNSTGYDWVKNNIKAFNLTDEDDLVGFTDLYCAVTGADNLPHNADNTKRINALIDGEKGCKITKVTFKGHNSSHGRYEGSGSKAKDKSVNESRNKSLSSERALTFKKWMMDNGFPFASEADASQTLSETTEADTHKSDSVDGQYIKAWRSASVIIEYESTETEPAIKQDSAAQTKTEGGEVKPVTDENGVILDKTNVVSSSPKKTVSPGTISTARDWLYNTDEGRRILKEGYTDYEDFTGPGGKTTKVPVHKQVDPWHFSMADAERITGKNYTNPDLVDYEDALGAKGIKSIEKSVVKRYDNEGEFFDLLDKKSPFLHHLITDKIKYFDPAYHAISPEGFNARLTFLHQCTRQGATIGNSDNNVQTAYNLAFGRPPICVLRIGDFYYTKIVINSMTINYDDTQWDLNPEGIGVMPMFAKINLDFTFIGGSDLAGPIARLQNAVSFNYYANTGVYDNRAERIEYDPTGTGKEIKYKPYNYPNGPGRHTASVTVGDGDNANTTVKTNTEWEDV